MERQTDIWETATGREIRICDMPDGHLRNTIKWLLNHTAWDRLPDIYFNMIKDFERRRWEQGENRRALNVYKRSIISSNE